jgi:predicted metal-binding membrane protein
VAALALIAVAGLAWLLTGERTAGMDMGPGTDPGSLAFYVPVWVGMMAAMMLPSAVPMVAAHSTVQQRRRALGRNPTRGASLAFASGYLLIWTAFGVVAYALFELVRSLDVEALSWSRDGPYVAGAVIAAAAIYQLSPLKDACLAKCRSPLAFVVGSWRDGRLGATRMGVEHGAWCVGCCWGLMLTLFALGVMSLTWMALVAALVTVEKTVPWGRAATWATAIVLLVLGVVLIAAPGRLPGLVVPGGAAGGGAMPMEMEMR